MTVACQMLLKNFILSFYKMLVRTQETYQIDLFMQSITVQALKSRLTRVSHVYCLRQLKGDGVWENVCSLATTIDKLRQFQIFITMKPLLFLKTKIIFKEITNEIIIRCIKDDLWSNFFPQSWPQVGQISNQVKFDKVLKWGSHLEEIVEQTHSQQNSRFDDNGQVYNPFPSVGRKDESNVTTDLVLKVLLIYRITLVTHSESAYLCKI